MTRRTLLTVALGAGPALLSAQVAAQDASMHRSIADLEHRHGGRLGVAILDTGKPTVFAYRGDERFPICSTYKWLAAAFVLARTDRKAESLDRRVAYTDHDLVAYSPVTEKHVGPNGLTVGELCDAAVALSDNTAGNLLLDSFGGPPALTAFIRSLGDPVTRLDRREPALNEVGAGDPRDTTTPVAMLELLHKTVVGTALSPASRAQLATWLVATKTGDKRLRAGVPAGWRVGDKTGTGPKGETNDVAVIWPPGRAPIIVTAYFVGAQASNDEKNAVLAAVGRLAASA